jgi:centromere protein J
MPVSNAAAGNMGNDEGGEENEEYDMRFPLQYHNKTPINIKVVEQIIGNDGKI